MVIISQWILNKMHSLENRHYSPEIWKRRQDIIKMRGQKPLFEQLMGMTRECMRSHPEYDGDVHGAIQCETIHPFTLSSIDNFTFHTHPMGDIDYPSDSDIKTTNDHNKDWLLIGLATKGKVVAYHKSDGFKKKEAEF
jgi:hypothetical protein